MMETLVVKGLRRKANGLQPSAIVAKLSFLHVCGSPGYTSK